MLERVIAPARFATRAHRWAPAALVACVLTGNAWAQGDAKRGEYLAKAAGCVGCHTEEKDKAVAFAGGRALKTPFGTFYGPNITPHSEAGIGRWSEADFMRALREGVRPDGANLFPAFPYPSFTRIADADARDLWAYLRALPPSAKANREHDLWFIFGWRWLVTVWKWFYFTPGAFTHFPGVSELVNRGAYLVQALGHCGECHTPRNFLGGPKTSRFLGGDKGPDGKKVPNLTPTRLKKSSDGELKDFLTTGIYSDGDVPAESMGEVIRNTTSQLTAPDLNALIAYLRTLPPVPEEK
ncbi:MAG: cytochrome c [Burkholderiales bacterium]